MRPSGVGDRLRWINLAAQMLLALGALDVVSGPASRAEISYDVTSLQGTYAYVNTAENVASFGLIRFDGKGGLSATIKVNRPAPTGGRTITTLSESGTYVVEPNGVGIATIRFAGVPESTIYDFLITQTAPPGSHHLTGRPQHPLATEVFSVSRSGGL